MSKLRVVIADDERPARAFLKNLLTAFDDVEILAEAESGAQVLDLIEQIKPDLAFLDLQMPELSGLEVVKMLGKGSIPLVVFVTAYDQFAVEAFEINAVDYLLKPVERVRLRETVNRAFERLEQSDFRETENKKLHQAIAAYQETSEQKIIQRIPVRQRDEIFLLPVREIVSVVADGELLNLTTVRNERFTINFRLKDLEAKLDATKFVRLSRGALANIEFIQKISQMPGGTYLVTLKNKQQLSASRLQSRILREQLLRL